jgi:hypothetical protein
MKSGLHNVAYYAAILIMIVIGGCDRRVDDIHGKGSTEITRLKIGSDLVVSFRTADEKLLNARQVEVALEDAIGDSLSELTIIKARAVLKPVIENGVMSITIPTTNDFRSGIWHITELNFTVPGEKQPIKCKEGEQFIGMPFHLLNFTELPENKPIIELSSISVKE